MHISFLLLPELQPHFDLLVTFSLFLSHLFHFSIVVCMYACLIIQQFLDYPRVPFFVFLFLSVLYHTVGTFVEHYLADTDEYEKNRFASAVVQANALMIIVWGGEEKKKKRRRIVVILLLLLFSNTTKSRTRLVF